MELISCSEMKALERYAIEEIGIPALILMENAAFAALKHLQTNKIQKYLVLAGSGNNVSFTGEVVVEKIGIREKRTNG